MDWHVQYIDEAGDKTCWHPSPEAAIEFACDLIDRGLHVFGIGDLEGSISHNEIARIHAIWVRARMPFGIAVEALG